MTNALGSGAAAAALLAAILVLPASGGAAGESPAARNGEIAYFRALNFYDEGFLYTIAPDGTNPRRLLKSGRIRDAAWSPDGKLLAVVDQCSIKIGRAATGSFRTIVKPRKIRVSSGGSTTTCHADLGWSPDGKQLVFMRCGTPLCPGNGGALFVVRVSGRSLRQLTQRECIAGRAWKCYELQDSGPSWSPDGQTIVFSRLDTSLPDALNENWANHARLYRIDLDGSGLAPLAPRSAWAPKWAPDGSRIAYSRTVWHKPPPGATWSSELRVVDADGTGERALLEELDSRTTECAARGFDWSADGTKVVFSSGPCPYGIYVMDADGGNRSLVRREARIAYVVAWRPLP